LLPPFQLDQAINRLVREEWGRILASLIKSVGSMQLAEDVLQDAVEAALVQWNEQGIPESPTAWLLKTARNKAIDHLRRRTRFKQLQPELSYLLDLQGQVEADGDELSEIPDKRLELLFTCAHPALDQKTRVALTLRAVGGLSTEEIARAFLDKPSAMAQRLVRARHKLAAAGIAYEVPSVEKLPDRVSGVLAVIYFIFNEGYSATSGEQLTRHSLSDEAIRLARVLNSLMPEHTETAGLLALMLLHDSRRGTRQNAVGGVVPLEHQDRARWNHHMIDEGITLLKVTLPKAQVGPYQLQAAISAVHAEASTWQMTDWMQIAALYEVLHQIQPSPVVRINQAVAVSYAQTPVVGLAMLDDVANTSAVVDYQPYRIARADLLFRSGRASLAAEQLRVAIKASDNDHERVFLQHRLDTEYAKEREVHTTLEKL